VVVVVIEESVVAPFVLWVTTCARVE